MTITNAFPHFIILSWQFLDNYALGYLMIPNDSFDVEHSRNWPWLLKLDPSFEVKSVSPKL
jgi:hypothetical protein